MRWQHFCVFFPFVESKVLLCDFHREKAWVEWTAKGDNGVGIIKDYVLNLLRNIAHAGTTEESAAAIQVLKNSKSWAENEKLRNWFGKKWLPNIKVQFLLHYFTL